MASRFLSCVVTISIFFSSVSAATADEKCHFPAIFNFGDSNSDTGGLAALFGQFPPPHGVPFFGAPAGRYCDGRLVIDFIAEGLRFPYLSAYLDSVGSDFAHGANFATAGATARPKNMTRRRSSPISLDFQWNQFYDFHNKSQVVRSRGGPFRKLLPKAEDFSSALYTFDIGQNDLTGPSLLNMTSDELRAYVQDVVDPLQDIVKNIYSLGGRYFLIHNTGPLGCLPYVLESITGLNSSQIDKAGCAIPYNEIAQTFNNQLKEAVVQLREDLPSAAITHVDVYSIKYSLFGEERKKHGFKQSLRTCCGHGGKYNYNIHMGCGGYKIVHGKEISVRKICEHPSEYVIWDGAHFTQAANKFIYDQIVGGTFSDPPLPLKMACHRMD
ncbi:hypothetical protein Dsin_010489 [Dipteronia sinensis]|uniref:GDSL esterase/lipase n=1 Tax=Dipteronia sinensis TaxID=43782 RepID=A0AAE0ECW2_9ROSI|nr:hypothetical protein Dsin_010489 [Dipteronia sinensis]